MFILYVDDAGSVGNHNERHFILGGVAIFESDVTLLEQNLDAVANSTRLPNPNELEFHGSQILPGTKKWRQIRGQEDRRAVLCSALDTLAQVRGYASLFGVVIDKAVVSPRDPIEVAFEQIITRFDAFLGRQRQNQQQQRGLVVFDKSTRETRLQELATTFRRLGHTWGQLRWIVDVPFFVDSRATRAIQYADLVTYSLWRRFEKDDGEFFQRIRLRFDSRDGICHGLYHLPYAAPDCDCPYCETRR